MCGALCPSSPVPGRDACAGGDSLLVGSERAWPTQHLVAILLFPLPVTRVVVSCLLCHQLRLGWSLQEQAPSSRVRRHPALWACTHLFHLHLLREGSPCVLDQIEERLRVGEHWDSGMIETLPLLPRISRFESLGVGLWEMWLNFPRWRTWLSDQTGFEKQRQHTTTSCDHRSKELLASPSPELALAQRSRACLTCDNLACLVILNATGGFAPPKQSWPAGV